MGGMKSLLRTGALSLAAALLGLACVTEAPRLRYGDLPLPGTDRLLEFAIYTPPGFHVSERLPLVVFLHGAGDGPDCFDDARVGQEIDAATMRGDVPRAVIVVPRGDLGFWENWVDGSYSYRDWVLRSLVPDVQTRYGTAPCPEGCHLIGISMGGHGALRFMLFEPGLFSSVTAISAPILDSEMALELANESLLRFLVPTERIWGPGTRESVEAEDMYLRWTRPEDLNGTRLMLAWAEGDPKRISESNERFDRHLSESGIPHEVLVFPGRHDWNSWTPALQEVLTRQVGSRPAEGAQALHTK